jgi:hypothetical protein
MAKSTPLSTHKLSTLLIRNGTVTVEYYFIVYWIDDGHADVPGVLRIGTSAAELTLVEDPPQESRSRRCNIFKLPMFTQSTFQKSSVSQTETEALLQ